VWPFGSPETKFKLGLQAPAATVALYNTTEKDTCKVSGAMVTELDYGVGEVVEALHEAQMYDNSVVILVSNSRQQICPRF